MNDKDISARNVANVEALYEADRRRDIDAFAALWAEDGRQTFWLASKPPPLVGRDALVAATRRKFEVRPPYGIAVKTEPLADPYRVLARLQLTDIGHIGGTVDLWCLFHFNTDGLITEIEEILDTADAPSFPE
jgi:hypothetical protein